jgi:hypothetical protein
MAKVTNSSTRSKRTAKKPVTKGQNPQRANRQAASTARVSQGGAGVGSGTARVTQSGGTSPKPAASRSPRAITNGSSPQMRQLRAKAVQTNRQAQGKPVRGGTRGRAMTLPNSRAQGVNLPKVGARVMRATTAGTPSPGRQARAQAQGQQIRQAAETRRNARAASARMQTTLRNARAVRGAAGAGRAGGLMGLAASVLSARNTAPGTLTAAQARAAKGGKEMQSRKPTSQETSRNREEKAALRKLASKKAASAKSGANRSASSFDSAFRDARRAGVKTFTWNGKKYTTAMK